MSRRASFAVSALPAPGGRFWRPATGLYARLASERLATGLHLLGGAGAVVTDRLHAHILSLLAGVPHVLRDNATGSCADATTVDRRVAARALERRRSRRPHDGAPTRGCQDGPMTFTGAPAAAAVPLKARDAIWTVTAIDPIAVPLVRLAGRSRASRRTASRWRRRSWRSSPASRSALGELVAGALIYQVSFLLDCMDGKLAKQRAHDQPAGRLVRRDRRHRPADRVQHRAAHRAARGGRRRRAAGDGLRQPALRRARDRGGPRRARRGPSRSRCRAARPRGPARRAAPQRTARHDGRRRGARVHHRPARRLPRDRRGDRRRARAGAPRMYVLQAVRAAR